MEKPNRNKTKGNRINACLYEIDMTRAELCELTQIDPSEMGKIIANKRPLISVGQAIRISRVLGFPVEVVFIM